MAKSLFTLPFGRYAKKDIEDVETSYLEWLIEQDWFCERFEEGTKAIQKELKYRKQFGKEKDIDTKWNRR